MTDARERAREWLRDLFPHGSPFAQNDLADKLAAILQSHADDMVNAALEENARLRKELQEIADFTNGYGDVVGVVCKKARAALNRGE